MQQPQGETRWQSMTDNPLAQSTQAQSMGSGWPPLAAGWGSPSGGWPS